MFYKNNIQKYIVWIMFIVINTLFCLKYLSKISLIIGIGATLIYIFSILATIKVKPTLSYKLTIISVLVYILTTSILLFFIPKDLFTTDRWAIIQLFWDSISNGLYPYAQHSTLEINYGNLPGAMPFYFVVCYPFYYLNEIGFTGILAVLLFTIYLLYNKRKKTTSFALLLLSTICIYWEIFARSTILINAVLFLLFFTPLQNFNLFTNKQLVFSAIIGGLIFSMRNVFILPLIVWGIYELMIKKTPIKKIILWGLIFLLTFIVTFLPFIWAYNNEFWAINPFITQSSLVPTNWIIVFIMISIMIGFICKTFKDVQFYGTLLLFGIVTVHFLSATYSNGLARALFNSAADISYYIFCIPFLLQNLTIYEPMDT